jgi:manganese transport protein
MEGFFEMQVPAWVVRVVTRAIAIVPAFIVVYTYGADSAAELIEQAQVPRCPHPRRAISRSLHRSHSVWPHPLSRQVVVNFVVPFTVIPLTKFLSSELKMGPFKLSKPLEMLCWLCSAVAIVLNMMSLYDFFNGLEALPSPVRSPLRPPRPTSKPPIPHFIPTPNNARTE